MITAEVIVDLIKNLSTPDLTHTSGSLQAVATKVLPPELADKETLVFVSKMEQLETALKVQASIIVAHKSLSIPADVPATMFSTPNIQLAMAAILPLFDGKMNRFNQAQKIHPTACIHETAHLGENVYVGPYAVIGEHARVGSYATIGSHVVIEPYAQVGDHTLIHPQVFVGAYCEIGAHCELHPHVTIGADGFAYAPTREGTHKKIPQIGKVVLGDWVELGANVAVDRAALTETRIGKGTKIDNFGHIAHNVVIGENCVMAAAFKIAGSSKVGNNCMFGGDVVITDHVTICDRVMVGGRSGVSNDITTPGAYAGYPLEPLRDNMKTLVSMRHITRMKKELSRIAKHLGMKEEE